MKLRFHIDWGLLVPVFILIAFSLTTLFSINISYVKAQIISLIVSLLAFGIFSQINLSFLRQFTLPIYLVSIVLLLIVVLVGVETRGSVRWIDLLGLRLQFSETLKPFLAICFANYVANISYPTKKYFLLIFAFLAPVAFLIYRQPDLGSALVYSAVVVVTLITVGFSFRWFLFACLPVLFAIPFVWTLLHDYQRQRIITFLHPTSDPLGTSYNSMQAIIAVGSGTFFGKGWFQGTQSSLLFLPERHTDFIFATLAEGLGFIGAAGLVITFGFLCYRVYKITQNTTDQFARTFSACFFSLLLVQGFMNIGMNIGILPIVGVTLPFVSFGGNSLLSNFIFLGILSKMSISQKYKNVLEIR
jgi:rod shape determining protein RodA